MIKKIQAKFSEEEWYYLKKLHKRSRTNSKRSSTLSHASIEEEKYTHSETASVASGKKSVSSAGTGSKKKKNKAEKLALKYG